MIKSNPENMLHMNKLPHCYAQYRNISIWNLQCVYFVTEWAIGLKYDKKS